MMPVLPAALFLALCAAAPVSVAQDSGLSGVTGAGPGEGIGLDRGSTETTPGAQTAGSGEGIGTGPGDASATNSQFAADLSP